MLELTGRFEFRGISDRRRNRARCQWANAGNRHQTASGSISAAPLQYDPIQLSDLKVELLKLFADVLKA
jgi:hypothetical protein